MTVVLETIPHLSHRYETCGDWQYFNDDFLKIRVSQLGDWKMEALLQFHELAEALMCKCDGVTGEQVDEFDAKFEENRPPGDFSEPGDEHDAPYRVQHLIATSLERLLASQLGVDWKAYEAKINALPFKKDVASALQAPTNHSQNPSLE